MANGDFQPLIQEVRHLELPAYETHKLANGMTLYTLVGGSEPVMKLEIVFRAGAWHEQKPGVAEVMAGLLSEGTQNLASADLAEYIESRGATLQTRGGVDTVRVRLYSLTRFLPELLQILTDIINIPLFDENELKVYTENRVERLMIDLKKNEVLAYRYLTEAMYGRSHPYGRSVKPSDYLEITTDDLRHHHRDHIHPDHAMIFASGSLGAKEVDLLHHTIGQWIPQHSNNHPTQASPLHESMYGFHEVDGPQSHQAAIRIGRALFPQNHPDYPGMYVLNTILGGYFGSRLMTEIRENQGLTYGIYSSVDSFSKHGCFYISTETATANTEKVIDSVQNEIKRLKREPIQPEELRMARNYMMGHLMTQLDGSFSSMDYIKSMKIEHLENEHFNHLIRTLQDISPGSLMDLANKYFGPEEWVTIVVK